ncbi:unnamed protein product [Ectocarpus sp. 4 AP-2014]
MPSRAAKAGAGGRSLGPKAGGEVGVHGKSSASPLDEDQLQAMKQKVETLQADLSRRQESYIRRERAFNMRIEELEEEVGSLKSGKMSWMQGNHSMESLKNMHQQILHNVEMVQDRSSKILQEQERALPGYVLPYSYGTRARFVHPQTELEKEKTRKDGGDSAWIERTRRTEAELDWAKEMADRLDRVNQGLSRENLRLKSQFKSQEDDRKFLIKQLVAIKKENQSLRQEREAAEASMFEIQQKALRAQEDMATAMRIRPASSSSAPNLPGLGVGAARQSGAEADASRYKEIIKRLKRLLETERRNLRQVRSSYAADLQQRTELENLLKGAVEEVVQEIRSKKKRAAKLGLKDAGKAGGASGSGGGAGGLSSPRVSPGAFSSTQRDQTLEMLLSRERVLSLLYAKTFPLSPSPQNQQDGVDELDVSNGAAAGAAGAGAGTGAWVGAGAVAGGEKGA